MRAAAGAMLALAVTIAPRAAAQDAQLHGYLDLRLVAAGDEPNWTHGGLGKLRWDRQRDGLQFGGAALQGTAQLSEAWLAVAAVQYQTSDRPGLDVIDAYLRYRPVSLTPWRWGLTVGAFFPPVSLENDGIGWTSPYTLTPSAINSWIGEEIRARGAEVRVEHRGEAVNWSAAGAAFVGNDPAGEQLAARGWSLSDLTYGLGSSLREPDLAARDGPPPRRYQPFVETDHRVGGYAELRADVAGAGAWHLLAYDNRADPTTERDFDGQEIYSWRTRFQSLGWQGRRGDWVLIAQGLTGDTEIRPSPFFRTRTDFWSGFLLLARDRGQWRPALRLESFGTRQLPDTLSRRNNEHGHALTAALNWQRDDHLRLTGELLAIDSARTERRRLGEAERQRELQVQLSLRWQF